MVMDEQEKVLEQGQAQQVNETIWEYSAQATGRIIVEAWDLPGNKTRAEV